jgi:hypothetical protein
MMTAYTIRFKKSPRAAVQTWTRFAASIEAATVSASRALDQEFFGRAVLVEVVG